MESIEDSGTNIQAPAGEAVQPKRSLSQLLKSKWYMVAFIVAFGGLGVYLLIGSHAATPSSSLLYTVMGSNGTGQTVSFIKSTDGQGGQPTTLITSPAGAYDTKTKWAPNGNTFAYIQTGNGLTSGTGQLYVANEDGTNAHQLSTPGYTVIASPGIVWASDSSKLLVSVVSSSTTYTGSQSPDWLWVNADGSGQTLAASTTPASAIPFGATASAIYYYKYSISGPTDTDFLCSMQIANPNNTSCFGGGHPTDGAVLSPDGTTIASTVTDANSGTGQAQIIITPVNGTSGTPLSLTTLPPNLFKVSNLFWVPNSKDVAFNAYFSGQSSTIWYMVDTTNSHVSKLNLDSQAGIDTVSWWSDSTMQVHPGSYYNPLTPARIADTRTGSGLPYAGQPIASGKTLNVQVTGKGGVPASGVNAVVLNVTEASATTGGYITVYPTGGTLPTTSTLNITAGKVVNNQTTATLGTNGQISIYNRSGTTNVTIDVLGYYAGTGNSYTAVTPGHIATVNIGNSSTFSGAAIQSTTTTKSSWISPIGPIPQSGAIAATTSNIATVQVSPYAGVPTYATAVVVEATVQKDTTGGYLTLYPAGTAAPSTSNVNFQANQPITKEVTVALGTNPKGAIVIANHSGSAATVGIDVVGYYTPDVGGMAYMPITPVRIADTRSSSKQPYAGQPIGTHGALAISLSNSSYHVAPWAGGLVNNLTVPSSTAANTALVEYAGSFNSPASATITYISGVGAAFNENTVGISSSLPQQFSIYNNAGSTNVVVDALGYYY